MTILVINLSVPGMPFHDNISDAYEDYGLPRGTVDFCNNLDDGNKRPRWWFGGVSSATVAIVVAPFDLVKSHMQTQLQKKTLWATARNVVRRRGFIGFYDGFQAAAIRQLTCTSIRFSIYEFGKANAIGERFYQKVLLASFAGFVGALGGIPLDVINVRMQTDMKWPPEQRRNYKHVFDALVRIPREEGFMRLYSGCGSAILKSAVGTIGQVAFYDEVKELLQFYKGMRHDDMRLYFMSSLISSVLSSVISQPFDVLKTVIMNSRPGELNTTYEALMHVLRFGPFGLFRGLIPTIARKGPSTVLLFLIYEQLRLQLGYTEEDISIHGRY